MIVDPPKHWLIFNTTHGVFWEKMGGIYTTALMGRAERFTLKEAQAYVSDYDYRFLLIVLAPEAGLRETFKTDVEAIYHVDQA